LPAGIIADYLQIAQISSPNLWHQLFKLLLQFSRRAQAIHTRTAMGAGSLPSDIPVEIEAVFDVSRD
jgi:hypothetical protein